MNKEKIVEELNEYMKGLDPKLSVTNDDDGDLSLNYDNYCQAWFSGFDRDGLDFNVYSELATLFAKKGYLTKFYNKAIELMDKYGAKYTVQVIADYDCSYLNMNRRTEKIIFSDNHDREYYRNKFTQSEIEKFKKRDDLAVDWDKAITKEVTD